MPATRLLAVVSRLNMTGRGLDVLAEMVEGRPRPAGAGRLAGDAGPVCAWLRSAAEAVAERRPAPAPAAPDDEAHATSAAAIRGAAAAGDRDATVAAVIVAWAGIHLDHLRRLEGEVAEAAGLLAAGPQRETPGG